MTDEADTDSLTREEKLARLRAPLPQVSIQPAKSWGGRCTNGDTPEARDRFIKGQRARAQYYGGTE